MTRPFSLCQACGCELSGRHLKRVHPQNCTPALCNVSLVSALYCRANTQWVLHSETSSCCPGRGIHMQSALYLHQHSNTAQDLRCYTGSVLKGIRPQYWRKCLRSLPVLENAHRLKC